MQVDSINLMPNASIQNLHIESGPVFPASPTTGSIFYLSEDLDDTHPRGLYIFDIPSWKNDNIVLAAQVHYEFFVATEGQMVFTFTNIVNTIGSHKLQIFVDGIKQIEPGNIVESTYTETNTNEITFIPGLTAGQQVECYYR